MAELKFNPGDRIKLRLAHDEIEGNVLESSDSSIVLIKLSSGYNIGIPKENILDSIVVKKFREGEESRPPTRKEPRTLKGTSRAEQSPSTKKEETSPPTKKEPHTLKGTSRAEQSSPTRESGEEKGNSEKPNIGLIITGGTIASKLDPKTGGVKHLVELGEFARFYPEMFEIVNVKQIDIPFMIASESMTSSHWEKIAVSARKMLNDDDISGIIITHGTDFLHYTSAALSFMLKELNKPVVLTYSQRSIDRASSDANLNLRCAARMAISDCAEVMLVGHGSINDDFCYALPGTKARKMHTSRRDAFKAVNAEPIAKVFPDRVEFLRKYRVRNENKVKLDLAFCDKVALVKFYPGQDPAILDFYALKYKGIVVEVSGLGHLPVSEAEHNWIPKLKNHIRKGFVVCAAPQTIYGRLDPMVYSNGRELVKAGVIFLEDMLAETAFVKLGYVLGHHGWKKEAKEKMLSNFAGEISRKIGAGDFI